ncbi:hypothetical protein [Stackebrandtia soli]|uniref:hypothetical protein n=1 Tax=Stackebrandtia soli TaxID=1892856 RepID=UPI0039E83959
MNDTNPMIADVVETTTATTGLWIVESSQGLIEAIGSGSWVDASIGGLTLAADALSIVLDPLGSLASMAVGWIMEHVEPLREALDDLAGDADTITSYANTWTNVSNGLAQAAVDLDTAIGADIGNWQGDSAQTYIEKMGYNVDGIGGISAAAAGMAAATSAAGSLVATVREIVRDLIADCVATLLVRVPEWLAEVGLTLGIGTPWVVSKAVALISRWVGRITTFLDALQISMQALTLLVG